MKRAFTLVELIVVIGIIGILAATMLAVFSGNGDSALAAQCLANMKNLASASQTYAMEKTFYPLAGSMVYTSVDTSQGRRHAKRQYTEVPGWISMDSEGKFPSESYASTPAIDIYETDKDKALYALTNGALWKYVSGNRNTYVCPLHARLGSMQSPKGGNAVKVKPHWSYLMNAYFGWNPRDRAYLGDHNRIRYGELPVADKLLLFSEIPFSDYNSWKPSGGGTDGDAILQFSATGLRSGERGANVLMPGSEEIGVNHVYKGNAYAHVAFADGHVEKLRVPMKGKTPDTSQMRQLTTWLCAGVDVSSSGSRFNRVDE